MLGLAALIVFFVYRQIAGLRRNIARAKQTGLPCIVARELKPECLLESTLKLTMFSYSLLAVVNTVAVDTQAMDAHHQVIPPGVVGPVA